MYFGHIHFQLLPVSPPRFIPKPSTLHLLLTYSSLCSVCADHVLIHRLNVDPSIRVLLTFHRDQLKENRFPPPRKQKLSVASLLMFSFPFHSKIQFLQRLLFLGIAFSLELQVKTRSLGKSSILPSLYCQENQESFTTLYDNATPIRSLLWILSLSSMLHKIRIFSA